MQEKSYRSAAEMVMTEFFTQRTDENGNPVLTKNTGGPILDGAARNKQGDYSKALSRVLLGDELKTLFQPVNAPRGRLSQPLGDARWPVLAARRCAGFIAIP